MTPYRPVLHVSGKLLQMWEDNCLRQPGDHLLSSHRNTAKDDAQKAFSGSHRMTQKLDIFLAASKYLFFFKPRCNTTQESARILNVDLDERFPVEVTTMQRPSAQTGC